MNINSNPRRACALVVLAGVVLSILVIALTYYLLKLKAHSDPLLALLIGFFGSCLAVHLIFDAASFGLRLRRSAS